MTETSIAKSAAASEPSLFQEFYDDWQSFDDAIARAIEKHHPLRKRSSLTFEVYNRTVSKGKHDRKPIADYLSKTYKCTHGIKFRSRGNGKRARHKLRDIGCPFHVYATAIEFESTYRIRVRTHDKHNHPIGPDFMENLQNLPDNELDLMATGHPDGSSGEEGEPDDMTSSSSHDHADPNNHQDHSDAAAADILDASMRETDTSFIDGALDASSIGDLTSTTDVTAAPVAASASHNDCQPMKPLVSATFEETMTFESLRKSIVQFAAERDWDQFHTPRNLLLALTGEVGEVCECFQWRGDEKTSVDDWTAEERMHLGEELSDVAIYLVRLADKCNIDLPTAIRDKMAKNAQKYPADLVRGSSKKYNEYDINKTDDNAL